MLAGNNYRLKKNNPNYRQIETTINTLNYISRQIQTINQNLNNFKWVLITLFAGIIFSFLLSFRNNFLFWFSFVLFILFSIIVLRAYLTENKTRKEDIKKLKSERAEVLGQLYILGQLTKENLAMYRETGKISQAYYQYLLSISEDELNKIRGEK